MFLIERQRKGAEFGQLADPSVILAGGSRYGKALLQQCRGGVQDLPLLFAMVQVARHDAHSRGMPRIRSAMMLRWISAVPPAIVSL